MVELGVTVALTDADVQRETEPLPDSDTEMVELDERHRVGLLDTQALTEREKLGEPLDE